MDIGEVVIEVSERASRGEYHACVGGDLRRWGCGRSVGEAVGSVVRAHLGERVAHLGGLGYLELGEWVRLSGASAGIWVREIEGACR